MEISEAEVWLTRPCAFPHNTENKEPPRPSTMPVCPASAGATGTNKLSNPPPLPWPLIVPGANKNAPFS